MTVKSTGRRTFFHQRGANAFLDATHFDFAQSDARIFHLGYILLLDRLDQPDPVYGTVAAAVLHRAQAAGFRTSVDLVSEDSHRFAKIVLPALHYCDYCVLNEFEAERTTGIKIVQEGKIDLGAARKAARKLLLAGVREWVVIHFSQGAIAVGSGGQELVQPSVDIPQERIAGTRRRRFRGRCAPGPPRSGPDERRPHLRRLRSCRVAHAPNQFRRCQTAFGMPAAR